MFSPFATTGLRCDLAKCGTFMTHAPGETYPDEVLEQGLQDMCAVCCPYIEHDMLSTGWHIEANLAVPHKHEMKLF